MSVVNQMLRDLDRRAVVAQPALDAGVAAVAARHPPTPWPARSAALLTALAAIAAGALGTRGWASADVAVAAPVVVAAAPRTSPPAAVPVTSPAPVVRPEPVQPQPQPQPEPRPQPQPVAAPTLPVRTVRVAIAAPTARSMPAKPAAASAPAAAAASSSSASATALPHKQFALVDRVQSARELWGAGNGEAATALLREVLAAPGADATGRAAVARELARLELMSRDPAAALQTLDRHAAELRGDAQAWALRGNATQRLGRHDDAVSAFEAAVRLQGDDTRSMLGAAVSLAATGDLAQARLWTDRARRIGPVPGDVLAYLSRLGVTSDR